MKHRILFCLTMLLLSSIAFAQDIIVTKESQKIEAKILEVSKTEIKYKEKDNLDGPTFVLETKEINSIIYSNGKVVLYNQPSTAEQKTTEEDTQTSSPEPSQTSNLAEANDYNMELYLLSGQIIKGKLMEISDKYVGYTYNAKYFSMPAEKIEKIVDLRSGKTTTYNGASLSSQKTITSAPKQVISTPKYVSRKGNTYYYDGKAMNEDSYSSFLQNNCPEAYDKFHSGNNIAYAGWILFSVGVGADLGSLIGYLISGSTATNTAFSILGLGCEIACIPTLIVGYTKKHKSVDVYNESCARKITKPYWSINTSQNGIGIAYNF